jgi:hypothetical protein
MSRRSATIHPPTGRTGSTASRIPGRTVEPSAEEAVKKSVCA